MKHRASPRPIRCADGAWAADLFPNSRAAAEGGLSCSNPPAGRRSRAEPKGVLGGHRPPGCSERIEGSAATQTWLEPTLPADLEELRDALAARIVGQEDTVDCIVRVLARYRAKLAGLERPVAAFLLLGPTGVGKTYTVEALADLLHGSPKAVLKIHCSEFCSDHELAQMKGAPPGYVGWRECVPLFHEARLKEVRVRSDLALVLFDEVEKAHPTLWDLLLGLLDKGEVVLNDNTRTDFRKTLVFLTGNAGGREVAQALSGGIGFAPGSGNGSFSRIAVRSAERVFSPEFRNRLTATLTYQPLGWEELLRVCRLELARLAARLRAREPDWVALQYEAATVEQIARQGYEAQFGARHVQRAIERMVEGPLANLLASGAIQPEDSIVICAGRHPGEGLRFRRKQ